MNTYETTFIISPTTPQEKLDAVVEKVKKIITKRGGQIALFEPEGPKKLAYPIAGHKEGSYFFTEFSAPGDAIGELENFYRITDTVLRYLTIIKPVPIKRKPKKKKKLKSEHSTADEHRTSIDKSPES